MWSYLRVAARGERYQGYKYEKSYLYFLQLPKLKYTNFY